MMRKEPQHSVAPKVEKKWVDDSDPSAALAEVMDGTPLHPPECRACNDTGKNSKGEPCHPCLINGRILSESDLNDPFA